MLAWVRASAVLIYFYYRVRSAWGFFPIKSDLLHLQYQDNNIPVDLPSSTMTPIVDN